MSHPPTPYQPGPADPFQPQPQPQPQPPTQPMPTQPFAPTPPPTAQFPAQQPPPYAPPPSSGAPYASPVPAQPAGYDPGVAAVPGFGPTSAPPVSGAPPSGPPLSGPPYGAPYGAPVPPMGPKRSRALPVLAFAAVLLLLLGGVMTGLFITKSGDLSRTETTLASREDELATKTSEADDLRKRLQDANEKLAEMEQDLEGTQNAKNQTEIEKAAIAKCLNQLNDALVAAARQDKAAYDAAMKDLDKICDEAQKYL